MANLTRLNWPLGWNPSDSENGNPDGLLRIDNLRQDKGGVLSLVKGQQKVSVDLFWSQPKAVYSKVIGNQEYLWASLGDPTTSVLRTNNDFGTSQEILAYGMAKTVFGDALGQVLVLSGDKKKKDNGTSAVNLGLPKPATAPTIDVFGPNQNELTLWNVSGSTGSWSAEESDTARGIDIAAKAPWINLSAKIYPNTSTLRAVLLFTYDQPYDTTVPFNDDPQPWFTPNLSKYDPSLDTFRLLVQLQNSSSYNKFRVEFLLDGDQDYYWYEWNVDTNDFKMGLDKQSILLIKRGDFKRVGINNDKDWKTVSAIRFSAEANSSNDYILVGEPSFIGGQGFELSGNYTYAYQYVSKNDQYIAKGPLSPASKSTGDITNGKVSITVPDSNDQQITGVWIYRRSSEGSSGLNQYYKVAEANRYQGDVFQITHDGLSDSDVLLENVPANLYLVSVQELPTIVGTEGLYNERQLYLTNDSLYLSDRLNPDAVDSRFTIKVFGDPTERNLWIRKLSNSLLILATTKDLYEVSGTLLDLPDGTIDVAIRSIGEKYPPLSDDFAVSDGSLFYVAADGVRATSGSNSVNISPQLRRLFQGESCHEIEPFAIESNDVNNYPIAINQGKLFISLPHKNGSRSLIVYDIILKHYRRQLTSLIYLHSTFNGRLLACRGNFIYELDYGTTVDNIGQSINFLTVFDHNGQPRNRKDTFTLKLNCNTGGGTVRVYLAKDGGSFNLVKSFSSSTQETTYINVSSLALGFRYAVKILADELTFFELYELSLEYEPRPEQVNYMRIPNTNLGSLARKRFTSYAFVIDTLGANVTFTPLVDNASKPTSIVNKATKLTNIHFFTSETLGTDIGGILESPSGLPFEFYNLNLEETISEKLPTPVKYLVIPANDYGSPNRKRFTSFKFQINTKGYNVKFTPRVDGVDYAPMTFNTTEKRTVEYFFDTSLDVTGIDIGGVLETLQDQEFEFYGVIVPQDIELLPPRLESLYLPYNNFGTASKKRIRTIPIIIDTRGHDVIYTPIVDGVFYPSSILNSDRKSTLFHYFTTDVFGVDFGGNLVGTAPFEFYGFGSPENVEVLPVGKKFDQFQPLRFDKIAKLYEMRVRLIPTGSTLSIPYKIYNDDNITDPTYDSVPFYSGSFNVLPNVDNVYEIQFPKNINSSIFRIVLGPTSYPFHRYDLLVKVATSGMESDSRWIPVR